MSAGVCRAPVRTGRQTRLTPPPFTIPSLEAPWRPATVHGLKRGDVGLDLGMSPRRLCVLLRITQKNKGRCVLALLKLSLIIFQLATYFCGVH
jgi:hypothetical protein